MRVAGFRKIRNRHLVEHAAELVRGAASRPRRLVEGEQDPAGEDRDRHGVVGPVRVRDIVHQGLELPGGVRLEGLHRGGAHEGRE